MFDLILEYLQRPEVISALLVLGDFLLSVFQYRKTSQVKKNTDKQTTSQIVTADIEKLIDYHEKVANELKNKKVG